MSRIHPAVRFFAYAGITAAVVLTLLLLAWQMPGGMRLEYRSHPGMPNTSEFSPVELTQLVLILLGGFIFAWVAYRDRQRRPMAVGLAGMFLLFLIREMDFFLDYYLVDNLWRALAAIVTAFVGVYVYRHRRRFLVGFRRSWPSPGIAMIASGLLILMPFGLLATSEAIWSVATEPEYSRIAKRAAEELVELMAFLIMAFGALEFFYAWEPGTDQAMTDQRARFRAVSGSARRRRRPRDRKPSRSQ